MKKRTVNLLVKVDAPVRMSKKRVAELVNQLVDIGLSDAADTFYLEEGDLEGARAALNIDITKPVVIRNQEIADLLNS
jgi:hypothetical protein